MYVKARTLNDLLGNDDRHSIHLKFIKFHLLFLNNELELEECVSTLEPRSDGGTVSFGPLILFQLHTKYSLATHSEPNLKSKRVDTHMDRYLS